MRRLIVKFIFLFLTSSLIANNQIDSLKAILGRTFDDKTMIPIYNQLQELYKYIDIDTSRHYAGIAYDKVQNLDSDYYKGICAANLADIFIRQDKIDTALFLYQNAIISLAKTDSLFDLTQFYLILGNIYLERSDFDNAFEAFHSGLKLGEEEGFIKVLSHIYNNMGVVYLRLANDEKALEYLQKAFALFVELDWEMEQAHALSNISIIHNAANNIDLAKVNLFESLKIFKKNNDHISQSKTYVNLGNIEFDLKNYHSALKYYENALKIIGTQDSVYLGPKANAIVSILLSTGVCHHHMGNIPKAEEYLLECFEISKNIGAISFLMNSSRNLALIFEEQEQFERSLEFYKTFKQLTDSIYNEESFKRITQLEMQYEFDKKSKENELQNALNDKKEQKKEFVLILVILSIFACAIIFILLFLNLRNKNKQQALQQDKLNRDLEHKNKELATNVMFLLKKNEFITKIAEQLTRIKYDLKKENQKVIQEIIRELEGNISHDSWNEFEIRFKEVHIDFYKTLDNQYPDLSPNEIKLCAFLRLNMSTKDISAITYQSVSSINMARFRLRKKMGIVRDENLISTLTKL